MTAAATVGWAPRGRDVVRVEGPDATAWLQGQLSQELADLAVGATTWSLLLAPQGKVDALLRVHRPADETYLLDTDAGWGAAVVERLDRFRLRTKAELSLLDDWTCTAVRHLDGAGPEPLTAAVRAGDGAVIVPATWGRVEGIDVLAPAGIDVDVADLPALDADDLDALRIAAGEPSMGHELDASVIPAEAGVVDRTVSFTKGCFVGQELVARIDSRGRVNRHLRLVVLSQDGAAEGDEVTMDGVERSLGHLASVAPRTVEDRRLALALLRREAEPTATVSVATAAGAVAAVVEAAGPTEEQQ